jgi:undecaprenyl pyrophosphate phosphatase UppP
VVTIWHGEGTSRDTSLLFLALILGFSDSVARRVSCILLFMPVNAPAETFPATVLYS